MATNPPALPSLQHLSDDELKRVFSQFDSTGDGKISLKELSRALQTLGSSVSIDELRLVVEVIDLDHDGFISFSEFATFCRSETPDGGNTELQDAFDLYDRDGDGLISAEDLYLALNRLGMRCNVRECREMIKAVDSDGDDNVNFSEFKQMMATKNRNV